MSTRREELIKKLRWVVYRDFLPPWVEGLIGEAADALECAPAEPLGDDVTRCRLCGEDIISTPDGAACLGGHAR